MNEQIVVTYSSNVLGKGEFWRGCPSEIDDIRNVPARAMAKEVVKDGRTRSAGMWTVKKTKGGE